MLEPNAHKILQFVQIRLDRIDALFQGALQRSPELSTTKFEPFVLTIEAMRA